MKARPYVGCNARLTEREHQPCSCARYRIGRETLLTRELFPPFIATFIATFMQGLPHAYRNTEAPAGTVVKIVVSSDIGGAWYLQRSSDRWLLTHPPVALPAAVLIIAPSAAWKLFSKSLRPETVRASVELTGAETLALPALHMTAVMA